MKKREIIKLINLNQTIRKYDNKLNSISTFYININELKEEFKELVEDFNVLQREIDTSRNIIEESKRAISLYRCDHQVRLEYSGCFINHSKCVLCGKEINGDNHYSDTIYNDVNRNRYTAMFSANFYDENAEYDVTGGYDIDDVYGIVLDILKDKNDEEDVDLVQEIKKLNLEKCEIDERKKEKQYYILIVSGSNKQMISNRGYITCDKIPISTKFAYCLTGIPRVNVEVFDNEDTFLSTEFKEKFEKNRSDNTRFVDYNTLEELKKKLDREENVPFDIIIDISSLYEYSIDNGQITSKKIDIDFKELFPDSYVIKIEDYGKISDKELLEILKEKFVTYNKSYGYIRKNKNALYARREDFYTVEDDAISTLDVNDACKNIRRVLVKK